MYPYAGRRSQRRGQVYSRRKSTRPGEVDSGRRTRAGKLRGVARGLHVPRGIERRPHVLSACKHTLRCQPRKPAGNIIRRDLHQHWRIAGAAPWVRFVRPIHAVLGVSERGWCEPAAPGPAWHRVQLISILCGQPLQFPAKGYECVTQNMPCGALTRFKRCLARLLVSMCRPP